MDQDASKTKEEFLFEEQKDSKDNELNVDQP
jgi:hypothetical protein